MDLPWKCTDSLPLCSVAVCVFGVKRGHDIFTRKRKPKDDSGLSCRSVCHIFIKTCSRFFAILPLSAHFYQTFVIKICFFAMFLLTETDFSRMSSRLHTDSSKVSLSDSAIICWMTSHPNKKDSFTC